MLSVDDATIGSLSFERKLKVTKGIVEVHAPLDDFPPCEGGDPPIASSAPCSAW